MDDCVCLYVGAYLRKWLNYITRKAYTDESALKRNMVVS